MKIMRRLLTIGAIWLASGSASDNVVQEHATASLQEMARVCRQSHDIAIALPADAIEHMIEHEKQRAKLTLEDGSFEMFAHIPLCAGSAWSWHLMATHGTAPAH